MTKNCCWVKHHCWICHRNWGGRSAPTSSQPQLTQVAHCVDYSGCQQHYTELHRVAILNIYPDSSLHIQSQLRQQQLFKHLSENLLVSMNLVQLATQGDVQSNPQAQATCLFAKWWIHSSVLVKWHISSKDNCYQKAAMEVHSRKRKASRHVKLLISGSKRFTRTQGTSLFTGRFGWNFYCWFLMATDFGNNATLVGTLYTTVHSKPSH